MQIDQFIRLTRVDKEELLFSNGTFLANYDHGDFMFDAYKVFDFYVASCFNFRQEVEGEITAHLNADELPHLCRIRSFFT